MKRPPIAAEYYRRSFYFDIGTGVSVQVRASSVKLLLIIVDYHSGYYFRVEEG
jgi:hypothetical protein